MMFTNKRKKTNAVLIFFFTDYGVCFLMFSYKYSQNNVKIYICCCFLVVLLLMIVFIYLDKNSNNQTAQQTAPQQAPLTTTASTNTSTTPAVPLSESTTNSGKNKVLFLGSRVVLILALFI